MRHDTVHKWPDDFSRSDMIRYEHATHQPCSSPSVNEQISPSQNPTHSPYKPSPPTHFHPSDFLEGPFENGTKAHHEEKPSDGPRVSSSAHSPHSPIVEDARDEEGAYDSSYFSATAAAKDEGGGVVTDGDETASEDLMPASRPEFCEGG